MGALCGRPRPGRRHEGLRRVGAAQGVAAQVRLRAGEGRCRCPRDARAQVRSAGRKQEAMLNKPDSSANSRATAKAETVAVAPPCATVIFGAGGDLTKRLIAPALYNLVTARRLPDGFRLVGVDRGNRTVEDWRKGLTDMLNEFVGSHDGEFQAHRIDQAAWRWPA